MDVASVNQSDGSVDWTTQSWLEIGETNGAGGGDAQIGFADGARNVMYIDNPANGWEREMDLSAAEQAILSFEFRRLGLDNAQDFITVDVSPDGGTSWTEIARFSGVGNDTSYLREPWTSRAMRQRTRAFGS